jgi:hypothetical protein
MEDNEMPKRKPGNFRYGCPKCGGASFRFYEYTLTSYDIEGVILRDNGDEDLVYGEREILEDTRQSDEPYECLECRGYFERGELKLVRESA